MPDRLTLSTFDTNPSRTPLYWNRTSATLSLNFPPEKEQRHVFMMGTDKKNDTTFPRIFDIVLFSIKGTE